MLDQPDKLFENIDYQRRAWPILVRVAGSVHLVPPGTPAPPCPPVVVSMLASALIIGAWAGDAIALHGQADERVIADLLNRDALNYPAEAVH